MSALVLVCGLPGAGKSELCRSIVNFMSHNPITTACHIEFDAREREFAQHEHEFDIQAWHSARAAVRSQVIHELTETKKIILLDDNFYYRSMRRSFYQLSRDHGVAFVQIFLDTQVDHCLARNRRRDPGQRVPSFIIDNMSARFEVPKSDIHSWEKHSIVADEQSMSSEHWLSCLADRIAQAIQDTSSTPSAVSAAMQDRDRDITAHNSTHQLDLCLRQLVSSTMTALSEVEECAKTEMARRLNKARKEHLAAFKSQFAAGEGGELAENAEAFESSFLHLCGELCCTLLQTSSPA
eukprot:GILJ01012360.1.p1 GENE.GILJ01012360.1~~GILJ01012360.1.p1  ORF type:complete len:295 (-),score=31.10 GILJ01012360.1:305-1189(-)